MGLIDIGPKVLKWAESIPLVREHVHIYRLGLETEEALARADEEILRVRAELEQLRETAAAERAALDAYKEELEMEEALLAQRGRQLAAWEASLAAQENNVRDFTRLQQVFQQMRARELVPILEELDDDVVARLILAMDERQAAQVLAAIDPARAASLSKIVGGISRKP